MVFVKHKLHNEIATVCLLLHVIYTLVGPLSMGLLYCQAENQNISKFACNFVFVLLPNPSSVEESSYKSTSSLPSCKSSATLT